MSLLVSFNMSSKMSLKLENLFTETEIGLERGFEIRIRDIRIGKTKNFSLFVKEGIKDKDLPSLEELKDFFEKAYLEAKRK